MPCNIVGILEFILEQLHVVNLINTFLRNHKGTHIFVDQLDNQICSKIQCNIVGIYV